MLYTPTPIQNMKVTKVYYMAYIFVNKIQQIKVQILFVIRIYFVVH